MEHLDRLSTVFRGALGLAPDARVDALEYRSVPQWDSLAHMSLIAAIEEEFDVMIDTDDVLDMSSFAKAVALLEKHGAVVSG
ncbi:acyl carrier protein [Streptosporangium sp. KLBMP 9127]|nr:acyl carrier protein [Streptosporangium sp. KLBMP 9127]